MTSKATYQHYLSDCVGLLKEDYQRVREDARQAEGQEQLFLKGQTFGLMQALSLLQQQAVAFNLPLGELQLADYAPEREL